jgi:hypothetical protein
MSTTTGSDAGTEGQAEGAPQPGQDTKPNAAPDAGADAINLFDAVGQDEGNAKPDGEAKPTGTDKPARPEHVPEQFWDADKGEVKIQALTKSWSDLRAQISRGKQQPPGSAEEYVMPKVEGLPEIVADDQVVKTVREAAFKVGLSKDQFAAISEAYLNATKATLGDTPMTPEQRAAATDRELQALGPNARAVVREVDQWINGLASRGILTQNELRAFRERSNADVVRGLMKLRQLSGDKPMPVDAMDADAETPEGLRAMLQKGYADNDASLREKALRGLERLEKRGMLAAR